jgi:hypothetical protein
MSRQPIEVRRQIWLHHKPTRSAISQHKKLWPLSDAGRERQTRIGILQNGGKRDRYLAEALSKAAPGMPARVMCCPVAARLFQIFFADRAMSITAVHGSGIALTLVDPSSAVPFERLEDIDWRNLIEQLRRRLERCVGKHVIVFGMGEVEANYDQQAWQPHFHLTICNASASDLKKLRTNHYRKDDNAARKMKLQVSADLGWHTYSSKLTAFRKVSYVGSDGKQKVSRKRLKVREFREHCRYVSGHQPTEFLFGMNCSILRGA